MLTCKDVATAIASGRLEEAARWSRFRVRLHLLMCRHCRRYSEQIQSLGAAARDLFEAKNDDKAQIERLERSILDKLSRDDSNSGDGPQ